MLFVPLRKHLVSTLETDERARVENRHEAKFENSSEDDERNTLLSLYIRSLYVYDIYIYIPYAYNNCIHCTCVSTKTTPGGRGDGGGDGMRNGKQTGTIAHRVLVQKNAPLRLYVV